MKRIEQFYFSFHSKNSYNKSIPTDLAVLNSIFYRAGPNYATNLHLTVQPLPKWWNVATIYVSICVHPFDCLLFLRCALASWMIIFISYRASGQKIKHRPASVHSNVPSLPEICLFLHFSQQLKLSSLMRLRTRQMIITNKKHLLSLICFAFFPICPLDLFVIFGCHFDDNAFINWIESICNCLAEAFKIASFRLFKCLTWSKKWQKFGLGPPFFRSSDKLRKGHHEPFSFFSCLRHIEILHANQLNS